MGAGPKERKRREKVSLGFDMGWLPQTINAFKDLISAHEFAGGVIFASLFIGALRRYFFRSSERVLEQTISELRKKCSKLEKALEKEQQRVRQCHEQLDFCKKNGGGLKS